MVCKTGPFCLAGVVQENLILTFSLFRLPFCPPLLLLLIGMVTSGEGPVERQTLSPRGKTSRAVTGVLEISDWILVKSPR